MVLRRSTPKRLKLTTADRIFWLWPYVEQLIGSIRRECLDHVIVINERSLKQTLKSFSSYDHSWRTHLLLGKDAPQGRQIQTPDEGKIIEIQEVGGLHHHYERRTA